MLLIAAGTAADLTEAEQKRLVDRLATEPEDLEALYRFLREFDNAARIGQEAVSRSEGLGPVARERALTEMATTLNIRGDLVGSVNAFERMLPVARENAQRVRAA